MPNKKKGTSQKMPELDGYRKTIRELSDRLVKIQTPIRLLDAIKWNVAIEREFFRHHGKRMPNVTPEYYQTIPVAFDPKEKISEFYDLERDIRAKLGQYNAAGLIMERMCREYREVVHMIQYRGMPEFSKISQELYGSANDALYAGQPNLTDLAKMISEALVNLKDLPKFPQDEKIYSSEEAVAFLQHRLNKYFHNSMRSIQVKLSDGIIADAAAGAETIRIRKGAKFSERELRVFEVHEGWVHIGTTLNGMRQPVCTFLSKGPPSSTVTQEGLAIIMEIFTFASYPDRVKRLTNRIQAVHMAEQGANFLEIYHFFREQGFNEEVCYANTVRVFRGSLPDGKPFTKDIVYSKGFILIYNYIRLSVLKGKPSRIELLFNGKTTLEDIRAIAELIDDKVVVPPKFVPHQFRDIAALSAWMCYSLFLNKLNLDRVAQDYRDVL